MDYAGHVKSLLSRPLWLAGTAPLVGLVVLLAATQLAAALPGDAPPPNPDAGLTDQERHAKYTAGREQFEERLEAWRAAFDASTLDLSALPRADMLILYGSPPETIPAAAAAADVIVSGVVTAIQPGHGGSHATFAVDRSAKGAVGETLTLVQGGFAPTSDWKGVLIGDRPGAPTLLPGDRAILLLTWEPSSEGYMAEPSVGTYRIVDGIAKPLPESPFEAELKGLSESALLDLFRQHVGK